MYIFRVKSPTSFGVKDVNLLIYDILGNISDID